MNHVHVVAKTNILHLCSAVKLNLRGLIEVVLRSQDDNLMKLHGDSYWGSSLIFQEIEF